MPHTLNRQNGKIDKMVHEPVPNLQISSVRDGIDYQMDRTHRQLDTSRRIIPAATLHPRSRKNRGLIRRGTLFSLMIIAWSSADKKYVEGVDDVLMMI